MSLKNFMYVPVLLLGSIACSNTDNTTLAETDAKQVVQPAWLQKWFTAWELVSRDILALPADSAPHLIFFDEQLVFTTAVESASMGASVEGPGLFDETLPWRVMPHKGQLTLPGNQQVPAGLMSFAGPAKAGQLFFVMAAPSFWKKAGMDAGELQLDQLLTAVFLHEFAHTRQYKGFGSRVDAIEKEGSFTDPALSDDIVQDYFKEDSVYEQLFRKETDLFYQAAAAADITVARDLVRQGLAMLQSRREHYFTGDKKFLSELDDIFLSMEGLGQYVAYAWLTHPKGAGLPNDLALRGFRRGGRQWSQEEGLALFLALVRLGPVDWKRDMFGEEPVAVSRLLEEKVK